MAKTKQAKFSRMLKIKKALQEQPMLLAEIKSLFKGNVGERTIQNYLEELKALELINLDKKTQRYGYLAIPDDLSAEELRLMQNHSRSLLWASKELEHNEYFQGEVTPEVILWQLVVHKAMFGEVHRLKQHLETGYYDEIWIPFLQYRSLMEKYDFPAVSPPTEFIEMTTGAPTNVGAYVSDERNIPSDDQQKLLALNKSLLVSLYELMIDVNHRAPLKGYCEHCPSRLIRIRSESQ